MAAKTATLTAAEEEQIIKQRFLHQATVARGEPPFKRLARQFIQLCDEAEKGASPSLDKAFESLMREVSLIELQAEKYNAILQANQQDQDTYLAKQQEMAQQIEQAKRDIEAKKAELEQARVVRQHNEEYEVLRHLVVQTPARAVTQREINKVKADIERVTAEGKRTAALLQKRRQQFALLFHVIEELQRTMDEPDEPAGGAAADEAAAGAQQMDVD